MDEPPPDRWTMAGFASLVLLIGLNFIAVRVSNQELAPMWGAALRYTVSFVLIAGLMVVRRVGLPRGAAFWGSVLYGTLNFAVFFGLVYWALVEVPASMGAVVLAAVPLITYLLALVTGLERFRWQALVGALVVIVGIGVIAGEGLRAQVPLLRFAAVVGAACATAGAGVVVKRTPRTHPLAMNVVGMAAGALLLVAATWAAGDPWRLPTDPAVQVAVVYLILSSVLLFVSLVWIIGRWTASGTSYAMVLAPIVTVIVGHLLLDEPITGRLVLGGILVLVGVYWGALRHGRPSHVVPTRA